jgi:hypothetical protein
MPGTFYMLCILCLFFSQWWHPHGEFIAPQKGSFHLCAKGNCIVADPLWCHMPVDQKKLNRLTKNIRMKLIQYLVYYILNHPSFQQICH